MKNIFVFAVSMVFALLFSSCVVDDGGEDKEGCTSNMDCPVGTVCNTATGKCVKNDNGDTGLPDEDNGDTGGGGTDCSGKGYLEEGECVCNTGYAGSNCEMCATGYTGYPDCKPQVGSCKGVDCSGNGQCLDSIGKCSCYTGFAGENCDRCEEGYAGYPDCQYKLCAAGDLGCKGNTVVECNSTGTEFIEKETCTGEGEQCYKGKCLDECGIAEEEQSYVGCEYWGAFLQNINNPTYALVVANPNDTDVAVRIYSSGETLLAEGSVPSKGLHSFELGDKRRIPGPGISDLGFKLVSSRPVTVTQMNPFGNIMIHTNDATLLIPSGAMGKDYFVMAWPTFGIRSCSGALWVCSSGSTTSTPGYVSIVAVEEGSTKVNVKYSAKTIGGNGVGSEEPGAEVLYDLNQYQILTLNSANANCPEPSCSGIDCDGFSGCYGPDLTGTFVAADKRIAVFSGSVCTFIPANLYACDHMEHQMFPLQSWGKNFVVARTKPRKDEVDYFRILASLDGTLVSWKGGVAGSVTLSAGQFHEFSTSDDFVVESNNPILVGQFLASQDAGAGTGDPAMMLIAPNEQLRTDYIFLVPPNYDYNRITIIAEKDTEIELNETLYSSNDFANIPGTNWYRHWVDMTTGAHMLKSSKPVGLYVYGFSRYVSYAYTAGLDLTTINPQY